MSLALILNTILTAQYTGGRLVEAQASNINASYGLSMSNGSGLNQASLLWSDRRTLAGGASENLDLAGALVDGLGATLTFTAIKGILIKSAEANTTILTVGNVTNGVATIFGAATQSFPMQPGELLIKATPSAAGHVITAGTADLIKIANAAGASATYDIVIWG